MFKYFIRLWIDIKENFRSKDEHEECFTQSYGIFYAAENTIYKVEPKVDIIHKQDEEYDCYDCSRTE